MLADENFFLSLRIVDLVHLLKESQPCQAERAAKTSNLRVNAVDNEEQQLIKRNQKPCAFSLPFPIYCSSSIYRPLLYVTSQLQDDDITSPK